MNWLLTDLLTDWENLGVSTQKVRGEKLGCSAPKNLEGKNLGVSTQKSRGGKLGCQHPVIF